MMQFLMSRLQASAVSWSSFSACRNSRGLPKETARVNRCTCSIRSSCFSMAFLLDGVENIHSRHGRPPDKVVPEPEWPERARIQHVRMYKEPWNVSPNVTEARGEYGVPPCQNAFGVRSRQIPRRT